MTCYQHREQEKLLSVHCGPPSSVSLAELCLPVATMLVDGFVLEGRSCVWRCDHEGGALAIAPCSVLQGAWLALSRYRGLGRTEVWPFL